MTTLGLVLSCFFQMSLLSPPAHRLVSLIVMRSSLSAQRRPTKSSHSVIACNYSPHVAAVCTLWKDGQSELEKHVWTAMNSKMCAQLKWQENVQNAQSLVHSWVFLVVSHYLTSWPAAPLREALLLLLGFRFLSFLFRSQPHAKCREDPPLIYCMHCPTKVIVKLN